MSRLERDRPSIKPVDKFTYKEVIRSVSSPHVIMLFLISFMVGMLLYGLALFLPSIVNQLGFSPNNSQLLSVGPFVGGFIGERFVPKCDVSLKSSPPPAPPVSLLSAYLSDHYESRGFTSAVLVLLPVAGFALYLGNTSVLVSGYFDDRLLSRCRTKIHIIRGAVLDGSRSIWICRNRCGLGG